GPEALFGSLRRGAGDHAAVPERPRREAPPEAAPREEAPRPERQRREEQRREAPAERQPDAQRPAEQPPAAETPTPEVRPEPEQRPAQRPDRNRGDTQAQPEGGSRPAERPRDRQPDQPPVPPAQEEPAAGQQGQAPEAPAEAPILDSQKAEPRPEGERPRRGDDRNRQQGERPDRAGGDRPSGDRPAGDRNAQRPPVDPGPPPVDDRAAQEAAQPREIRPATAEEGRRRDRRPDDDLRRRERPSGADIVRELGDRLILQLGGETIVESNERPRMTRGARDVYYEDLPQGRTREVILRDNGVRIVTIRNRYGDVVQRSRIDRDGREYVLSYVDERNYERVRDWRDPGDDLPPLRLTIPRDDYILESERARDPDDYYEFLEQPPVERVQRLYSVDEVKRSARVRDIARRVDLDTLTFEFGSASIPESEVRRLEGVATAMERLLDKNPAETFLIEGHTDAVGSDIANLALSDRRAEAVAQALTDVFGIPPENLSTQGYGERYLKVNTQAPERENRRVAIRRITPLVAPVASAK
ncbi:MAG: OmpA family protein, partial [Rhizobiaceae bacterium]